MLAQFYLILVLVLGMPITTKKSYRFCNASKGQKELLKDSRKMKTVVQISRMNT